MYFVALFWWRYSRAKSCILLFVDLILGVLWCVSFNRAICVHGKNGRRNWHNQSKMVFWGLKTNRRTAPGGPLPREVDDVNGGQCVGKADPLRDGGVGEQTIGDDSIRNAPQAKPCGGKAKKQSQIFAPVSGRWCEDSCRITTCYEYFTVGPNIQNWWTKPQSGSWHTLFLNLPSWLRPTRVCLPVLAHP